VDPPPTLTSRSIPCSAAPARPRSATSTGTCISTSSCLRTDVWGLTESARKTTGVDQRVLPQAVIYDAQLTNTDQQVDPVLGGPGTPALGHLDGHVHLDLVVPQGHVDP
jgi:hypothetical protein